MYALPSSDKSCAGQRSSLPHVDGLLGVCRNRVLALLMS